MTDYQSVMSAYLLQNQSKMAKNQSYVTIEPIYKTVSIFFGQTLFLVR